MNSQYSVKDLKKMTREELYKIAKELNIKGRSTLSKEQLIANINQARENLSEKSRKATKPPTSTLSPIPRGKPQKREKSSARQEPLPTPETESPNIPSSFKPVKAPDTSRISEGRLTGELPLGYGDTKIVVQVRDPYWAHSYWEISELTKSNLRKQVGEEGYAKSAFVLRIHDVTNIGEFSGTNSHGFQDIHVFEGANNWYLHLPRPNRAYIVDLGIITPQGKFVLIARSNRVSTPRDTYSDTVDDQWMVVDEKFQELYRLSGGFNVGASSGELKQAMIQRLMQETSSGAISSLSSPVRADRGREQGKDFWLVVNTELIVYGATEPDATLTVQGKPVRLRPDGTFSLRYALPDGDQHIPVHAVNSDGDMERTITPIVKKFTR